MLRNQVQFITYPDSLGGTLKDVHNFIEKYLHDSIGGVHLLPFYPSSADRGFAPLTHLEVDPDFGTWEDIKSLSEKYDLIADLTVNHLSCQSEYFKDYLEKGERSLYSTMFLAVETFLDRHDAELDSLENIYKLRMGLPFTSFQFQDGTTKELWTTFTNHQVDLDVESDITKQVMMTFITKLADSGAKLIRLDAVAYTIKKPWTSSFLIPETFEFIRWLRNVTPTNVQLLAEVHHDPEKRQKLLDSNTVEWVYDFSLPLLTLHALYSGDLKNLRHWINIRPNEQITTLDTHDGIGVVDVEGLMTPEEIEEISTHVKQNGANQAYRSNGDNSENLDVYQLNCTYYSALGEDDDAYIVARAIQFFIPGIPQVYYVGLLAGSNDDQLLERTGHGRDVNRHNYTWSEIEEEMHKPVVQRLLELMRFRSHHPAFQGEFSQQSGDNNELILRWDNGDKYCQAHINIAQKTVLVELVNMDSGEVEKRLF